MVRNGSCYKCLKLRQHERLQLSVCPPDCMHANFSDE